MCSESLEKLQNDVVTGLTRSVSLENLYKECGTKMYRQGHDCYKSPVFLHQCNPKLSTKAYTREIETVYTGLHERNRNCLHRLTREKSKLTTQAYTREIETVYTGLHERNRN